MRDFFCFFLRLIFLWASLAVILPHADDARADIAVRIELARQEMNIEVDGIHYATWAVSTARRGN